MLQNALWAQKEGLCPLVFTFRPHPVRLLAPELAPPSICSLEDKRHLLAGMGFESLLEQQLDRAFLSMEPVDFIHKVLIDALHAKRIFVGYDFSFGAKRKGDPQLLKAVAETLGAQVQVIPPQAVGNGLVVSSTKIRAFLHEGRVDAAALALGRLYHIVGRVIPGEQRGRTLGFPTANLATLNEIIPPLGTYTTWVLCDALGPIAQPAITNIGQNPTFHSDRDLHIETHILGKCPDLYGQEMRLFFAQRLRDECRFENADALVQQIHRDVERAKELLLHQTPPVWG